MWKKCSWASTFGGNGDLGLSVGSSAASKLLRSVVDGQLRQPRLIKVDLNSADDPWFRQVVRLDSRNRISIGNLWVHFRDEKIVEVEGHDLHLNSTTLINNAALPLWFLDQKSVLVHIEVKRAYLRLSIDQPASMRVDQCQIEQGDMEMTMERSYLLSLLLNAFSGTMSDQMVRNQVCGLLLNTVIDLHERYRLELPFKSLIPEKFTRYLINDNINLRSRIHSINAVGDQITITAIMEWTTDSITSTSRTLTNSVRFSDLFSPDDLVQQQTEIATRQPNEQQPNAPPSVVPSTTSLPQVSNANHSAMISERLLLWAEDKLFNDLFKQFRWDFQWVNESIQLNSAKLPQETRDFFEVICPQCFFLFNISADGIPDVQIRDKSIIVRNRNRIAAAVFNPTFVHPTGLSGKKRTAIDLSMQLQLKFVPQIQDGIFRTHLELLERKVEVRNGSAFPSNMNKLVEQLIQDLIAEDIWPVLQRELEPLIYQSGIQLPTGCGLDPKSAQLQFEQGRFGISAHLFLEKWSNVTQCIQQFKSGLPDPSKLFINLPKEQQADKMANNNRR